MKKSFAFLLVLIAFIAAGCRNRNKPVVAPPAATGSVPAPQPEVARVEPPARDFVQPPSSADEVLSSDLEELNRTARERGWIADAFFPFDSFVLTADAQSALTRSAQWLRDHPDYALHLEGHCDERGTEQYNLALGDRRANTARTYLLSLGIDGERLTTVSYGEERPFAEGHGDEAWSQNRRAHLVIGRR